MHIIASITICLVCVGYGSQALNSDAGFDFRSPDDLRHQGALSGLLLARPPMSKAWHLWTRPSQHTGKAWHSRKAQYHRINMEDTTTIENVTASSDTSASEEIPEVPAASESYVDRLKREQEENAKVGAGFNQFDPVLSATEFISRRFGIFGGLGLVALLAATEGKEIVGALLQPQAQEGAGEIITTPSGLQYIDNKISFSGAPPAKGNLVGIKLKISIGDQVIYDDQTKKIAFPYGKRPFPDLICQGVEEGLSSMKPGGKRTLLIPKNLAPEGVQLPDGVVLTYDITLEEVLPNYMNM